MDLKSKAIDIDAITADPSVQVRSVLDWDHVGDLVFVFNDNRGNELPPVVVFEDADGVLWLSDGFHRFTGAKRAGNQSIRAEIREGSKDEAILYAARANTRNGMRLSSGDKTRAIKMAHDAAKRTGKSWGVRELARHIGCDPALVSRALGVLTAQQHQHEREASASTATKAADRLLHDRIDAALRSDPSRTDLAISDELKCTRAAVARRREALGIEPISRGAASKERWKPIREAAERLLREHPDWTNARIAEESGSSPDKVSKMRKTGIGQSPEMPKPLRTTAPIEAAPPSAPPRPSKPDARDCAEVVQLHPDRAVRRERDSKIAKAESIIETLDDSGKVQLAARLASRWPRIFYAPSQKTGGSA